jgi:hypothetical protein
MGGNKVKAPRILSLGTRWRKVTRFTHRPFIPGKRASGTHWIGGWVGHITGLDAVYKMSPRTTVPDKFLCIHANVIHFDRNPRLLLTYYYNLLYYACVYSIIFPVW